MKKQLTRWAMAFAAATPVVLADGLESDFRAPPDSARPGVYWYFLDGSHSFVTHNFYKATSPLQPSGLIGPVSILAADPGQ